MGIRVARSLYGRWRLLPRAQRERTAGVAEDAKEKALAVRGTTEPRRAQAEADLRAANESLAEALVESAEADPEIAAEDVDAAARGPAPRARAGSARAPTLRLREAAPGANTPPG